MNTYTVRTEQVQDGWVAWIDMNGEICIRQENRPGLDGFFATQSDAQSWAEAQKTSLEQAQQNAIDEKAKQDTLAAAQLAAYQAQIDTANHLKAIVDALPKA